MKGVAGGVLMFSGYFSTQKELRPRAPKMRGGSSVPRFRWPGCLLFVRMISDTSHSPCVFDANRCATGGGGRGVHAIRVIHTPARE